MMAAVVMPAVVAVIGQIYSLNHYQLMKWRARTKAVVANIDPSPATDIPDAVDVAKKGGEHKGNTFGDNSAGGSGPGHGGGSGGGNGTGVGTGNGDGQGQGNGNGNGNGNGDGHGTVKAAFDTEGFRARVQDKCTNAFHGFKKKITKAM